MKKAHLSPVTALLLSLSLALGILVGELSGFRLLTRVHAQESPCASQGGGTLVRSPVVNIDEGISLEGITVRNVVVNGELVEEAVVAGTVQIAGSEVNVANGVFVGGVAGMSGVFVGGVAGTSDVCVDAGEGTSGVYVGGAPVDGGEINLVGVTVNSSGIAVGGTLTGDNIAITNGVITGQNLLLSDTVIDGGSTSGIFTSVQITPAN